MSLAPCSSCSRHVRASEAACPFCGVGVAVPAVAPRALSGLSRAMIVLGGAVALGAAVEACGGETVPTAVPVYGAPASVEDAGTSVPIVPSSASATSSVTSPPAPSSTAATAPATTTTLEQLAAQPGAVGTSSSVGAMVNGYGGPPHTPNVVGSSTPPPPPKKKK